MNLKKVLWLVAVLMTLVLLVPLSVGATLRTWDAGDDTSNWTDRKNWSANTVPNAYTDTAKINFSTYNPVSLSSTILLGGVTDSLTIGSAAGATALNLSGTLGMRGGISNEKIITLSGTLRNDATAATTHYAIHGAGSISMTGGTISSTAGGIWDFNQAVSGYGTISAPVINNSTITAASGGVSGKILKISNAVTGAGDVIVGLNAADTVMLDLGANLGAKNFTLNQAASLKVGASNTITLTGNFTNNSKTEGNWLPPQGFNLTMSGTTFEVAGCDNGATSGFSNNFNLNTLMVTGNLQLVDLVDNGNRTGIHGAQEALYVNSLTGSGTLDLHGLWCYVNNGGAPFALGNGLYNGVTVSGAAAPIPGSVLLMGAGLMGLGLLRFRRRERKI
jgi:hypothetical protein